MIRGQVTLAVEHNFETAHRLPFLGGKCENLHGHSWKVKIHLQAKLDGGMDENGISVEYGSVKKVIRQWIDMYLDHGTMLGWTDMLVESDAYLMMGKVFIFGAKPEDYELCNIEGYAHRPWPTVEAVAEMLVVKLQEQMRDLWIIGAEVQETATNSVTFTQAVPYNKDVEIDNG